MSIPIHRHNDKRSCGATTRVKGQSTVYINNELVSVQGDENTHGGGALTASVNDGTFFINNKKVVLKGSLAAADKKSGKIHKPTKQKAVGASPDVFACGGGSQGQVTPADGPDPTREELYGTSPGGGGDPAAGGSAADVDPANASPGSSKGNVPADQNAARNIVPPESLKNDADFQRELNAVKARYPGLTDEQIYKVIQGESSYNTTAVNSNSGASGFFQFTPDTANELGYTTAQIQNMTPAQQMNAYGKYLDRWNYNPENELGIMQAAPAYASSRSGNDIVYNKGSAAWRQNPGWRDANGNITVDSINSYYRNQG